MIHERSKNIVQNNSSSICKEILFILRVCFLMQLIKHIHREISYILCFKKLKFLYCTNRVFLQQQKTFCKKLYSKKIYNFNDYCIKQTAQKLILKTCIVFELKKSKCFCHVLEMGTGQRRALFSPSLWGKVTVQRVQHISQAQQNSCAQQSGPLGVSQIRGGRGIQ